VVIPQQLRRQLGIEPGGEVEFWREGDHVVVRPVAARRPLLRRVRRDDAEEAVRDLRAMLAVELPTETTVRQAASIKAVHPMSYADAFAAATALAHDGVLWTGDPGLLAPGVPWRSLDLRA
jgi:AbrB family looped-hinge helix DNA binding protein